MGEEWGGREGLWPRGGVEGYPGILSFVYIWLGMLSWFLVDFGERQVIFLSPDGSFN